MGYREAIEDKIKIINNKNFKAYYPKCHICGEEVQSLNYLRNIKYTCKNCKLENQLSDKEKKVDENYDTKEKKFQKALKRFERMDIVIRGKYKNAADKVHERLHNNGWFDSTEEIVTAIELEKNNIKYRHQVKFGTRYRVDFVLDDEKVILEVDGRLFHTKDKLTRENLRDDLILLNLGIDWEVVRITDDLINQNIKKLLPAIRKIKEKRKLLREEYGGCLPDWYSDRTS